MNDPQPVRLSCTSCYETRSGGDTEDCDRWSGLQRWRLACAASALVKQSNASVSRLPTEDTSAHSRVRQLSHAEPGEPTRQRSTQSFQPEGMWRMHLHRLAESLGRAPSLQDPRQ